METPIAIPLGVAQLCVECSSVVEAKGDTCPRCNAVGCLLSLARVLNPDPKLGAITYIFVSHKKLFETVSLEKL